MGSLRVLEAENPKGVLRAKIEGLAGLVPSRSFRGEPIPSLLAAGRCRGLGVAGLMPHRSEVCLLLGLSFLSKGHSGLGTPNPGWSR